MCNKADDDCPWLLHDVQYRFRDLRMIIRATIHPLRFIPSDHPRAQGVCERVVEKDPSQLTDVPGHFKTRKMCDKAVDSNPLQLEYVPSHFKTQEMCNKAVDDCPSMLGTVPDHVKTRGMCNKAVDWDLYLL